MRILGIDPGSVSGAWGIITTARDLSAISVRVGDLPVVDRMVDAAEFARLVQDLRPDFALVEKVGGVPRQSAGASFNFGMGTGIIHGVLGACKIPRRVVAPATWKGRLRLSNDGEKSRGLAIHLYPEVEGLSLKKHHNRAEALLIAEYARIKIAPEFQPNA